MGNESFDWTEIFDAVHNDLMITDRHGVVVYANKANERLYLIHQDEMIGKTVEELEGQKIFNPSITRKVMKEKKKQTIIQETKIGTKVLVTANPIFDEQGEIKWIVSYSHDVTELLQLKEHVKKVQYELNKLRSQQEQAFISVSAAMNQVFQAVEKIADFDVNVLLTGESGVGKSYIARYIHQHSRRKDATLVEINCAAIPESLLESELFGYEAGSFSGAKQKGKKGLIEEAEEGTLFLDEIGELPLALQAKLLTVIQEKTFYRVGGTKPRQVDFRLIAATNVELKEKVKQGAFRQDLFFRLSVVPIHIPPLRERVQDVYSLIIEFTQRFNLKYGLDKSFSPKAIEWLAGYDWPGNVRELEHMVERVVLTSEGPFIEAKDLPDVILHQQSPAPILIDRSLTEMVESYEREIIRQAYAKCRSTTKLAEYLGISQPTAVRKIQKYVDKQEA